MLSPPPPPPLDRFTLHFVQSKGSQIIRNSRSHLKILVAGRVTGSKLQTEDTQTLGATLHNLVAMATLQLLITIPFGSVQSDLLTVSLNEKINVA